MTCPNKFPIGVPFSIDSKVSREELKVYVHRQCPLCKEWFKDEVVGSHHSEETKLVTNNYAEHFTPV